MDQKEKIRVLKAGVFLMGIAFVIGSWLATQNVAALCEYDPALGYSLQIKGHIIYSPHQFWMWEYLYSDTIPNILEQSENRVYFSLIVGFLCTILYSKSIKKRITHGSAEWADKKELEEAKITDKEGVIIGKNPYTGALLRHNGAEHILLMAPTRSGKGVNTIIPTCFEWIHSLFVLDVKGENWEKTAGYRKNVLRQQVMKFDPLSTDGSSVKWNVLAEIGFRTDSEYSDTQNIVNTLANPTGTKELDYWGISGSSYLCGSIIHLLYSYEREDRPLPSLSDLATFLVSPTRPVEDQLAYMRKYPHISQEEFLSENNVFQKIYGEYVKDFKIYNDMFDDLDEKITTLNQLKKVLSERNVDFKEEPFCYLLVHPKVLEAASEMANKVPQERSGVISSAKNFLNLYQNPIIARNTLYSEFRVKDLLDLDKKVSLYLVIPPGELNVLKPLCRLLINCILKQLIGRLELTEAEKSRKRLLMMLDEFPQFGNIDTMEQALAVCAGYGIKMCVVCQDVNQLNKAYTKDNSVSSNCHVQIFFTPNMDTSGATATYISKVLGKKTILIQNSTSQNESLLRGSVSTSAMGRELMTPDEVNRMPSDRGIVFVAGHKPAYVKKIKWFNMKEYKAMQMPYPKVSDHSTLINNFATLRSIHKI
jgi:type IV secretion system protein VirD4